MTFGARRRVFTGVAAAAGLVLSAVTASAQISGVSQDVGTSSGSPANNADGSTTFGSAVNINTGTSLQTRHRFNVNADIGALSTRDQSGTAVHNVSFTATAPGGYRLDLSTQRRGDINRLSDVLNCDGSAAMGGVSTPVVTPALTSGALTLPDPADLGNGGSTTSLDVNQSNSGTLFRISNGVGQAHSFRFTYSANVRSNSCEAAVRVGEQNGTTTGCTACIYPGSPSRTQANDGLFFNATFTSLCGNGVVDGSVSEQCDQGSANGAFLSCCTTQCLFKSAGTNCRLATDVCDAVESCTGSSANCPADGFLSGATVCRPSAGVCDVAENCTGSGPACPADGFQSSSTVCRASAGICDVAENCTGSGPLCPGDVFQSSSTVCRPGSGDVCDPAENCTGSGAACPGDVVAPNTTVCNPGSGDLCDPDETCTGVAGQACPADTVAPNGTTCRPGSGDLCDPTETCTGVADAPCPPDSVSGAFVICRAAADVCDAAENCTGVALQPCPADAVQPNTTVCRPAAGVCDVADNCDGVGTACPADVKSTAVCRASAGLCDVAESCDGVGDNCPADAFAPSSTVCRPSAGACDVAENCTGSGASCPADTGLPDTDSDTICDAIDNCDTIANTSQDNNDSDPLGDACDPCTNIAPTAQEKAKLTLTKLLLPTGDDKVTFKGFFTNVPTTPTIDPLTNGMRFLVTDNAGVTDIDVTIPPGAYNNTTKAGWKVNGSGTSWTYKNAGTVIPLEQGIQKMQLKAITSTPGKYKFGVKGKNADYVVNQAQLPLIGTIVIDVPFAATGQCGEAMFPATFPTKPSCTSTSGGKTVKCK